MIEPASLKGAYLVAGLADDQLAQIAAIAELRHFNSGQVVANIGDDAKDIFLVLDGTLMATTEDGDRLGEIGRGSIIGEVALVDSRPRTANVVCVGPVATAVIPIDALRKLLNANRDWGFLVLVNVAKVLAGRLRHADAMIDDLSDRASDVWTNALG